MSEKPTYEELERRVRELEQAGTGCPQSPEQRKEKKDNLQQHAGRERQRFFAMVETLPVMVSLMRPDHTMVFANQAFRQKYGSYEGKRCFECCHGYDQPCEFCESFVPLQTGQPHHWEFMSPDGSIIIDSYATVFPDQDGSPLILEMDMDITERKQAEEALRESEERLQLVMEGSQLGYWDWNIETGEVRRNEIWARMLGYTLQEVEDNVRQWTDLHHHDDRGIAWQSIQDHLAGKTAVHRAEYRMLARNGQYRWILDQARIVKRDAGGRPVRMSGTHTDITERKQAEEERERLREQLVQAQKMDSIGRLAGGVAHDFNNMLSVILGHTELLLEQFDEDHLSYGDLEEIQKAALRSADITRQLLAFARKQIVTPKVLDLNGTVDKMLKMLRRLIGEGIELSWKAGQDLAAVRIDPSQIDQVMVNLCINSRDAIAGTGKMVIETANVIFDGAHCEQHPDVFPGKYVVLAVSDNGCGMDQGTMAHLFEPFFTTKDVDKGSGLGLATVYGIVKQNNGFINVYSELGQGTTFRIYLPQYHDNKEALEKSRQKSPVERGHETILLVEDEHAILKMTKMMLERMGYRVIPANTPGEALQAGRDYDGGIDLLLTDVIMPEMNGRELARKLLTLYPAMKRLFMSGYTADVIAHHGVLDEGIQFIQKPFSRELLSKKVREILDGDKAG